MNTSLTRLLGRAIDYAGLFPPAQLGMSDAVREYRELKRSRRSWIVDKFVCNSSRLAELASELKAHPGDTISVSVVGSPLEGDPGARIRHDVIEIQEASSRGQITVEAYDAKITEGESKVAAIASAKRLPPMVGEPDLPLYAEVGWREDMVETMHEAAAMIEDIGFKARTGGIRSDAFPSPELLAAFISECAALDAPFKFTAGLHSPIRYFDESLGVHRHGFLNVILAAALAVTQDLSRREIQRILEITDPSAFVFATVSASVDGLELGESQIEGFLDLFGGFGSCSIDEPIDGLVALGFLQGEGA